MIPTVMVCSDVEPIPGRVEVDGDTASRVRLMQVKRESDGISFDAGEPMDDFDPVKLSVIVHRAASHDGATWPPPFCYLPMCFLYNSDVPEDYSNLEFIRTISEAAGLDSCALTTNGDWVTCKRCLEFQHA